MRNEERIKTTAKCLTGGGDYRFHDWKIDGRKTGGDPDLFKFFVERAWRLLRPDGRAGLLVPSGIYNNEGCTGLRRLLLDEARVERFYAFENREKIFPIHSSYKFVCLVFARGGGRGSFEAVFMRHHLAELEDDAPKPWTVRIEKTELERLSPGTLAFLEYRKPRDREILLRMYEGRPLLGDEGEDTWNARFYREFDMTNDRDLWTRPDGRLYTPKEILGKVPADFAELRAAMAEKGFWPLYEGKHIDQFVVDTKPIERWVSLEACEKKNGKLPDAGAKVVFRDIASNTNERTCLAAVLPNESCANNKLPVVEASNPDAACTILNSLCFDFAIRFRVSGTLNFTHISRVAVPPPAACANLPAIETISLAGRDETHITDLPDRWEALWQANRAVAEAYGLDADDLAYILTTFPVFRAKRPEFDAYLRDRIEAWRREGSNRPSAASILAP